MTELVARALNTVPEPWPPAGAEGAWTWTPGPLYRKMSTGPDASGVLKGYASTLPAWVEAERPPLGAPVGTNIGPEEVSIGLDPRCVREVYRWSYTDAAQVYAWRAVNNGRSVTWSNRVDAPELYAVWLEGSAYVHHARFSPVSRTWEYGSPYKHRPVTPGAQLRTPNVAFGPGGAASMSWIERVDVDGSNEWSVCGFVHPGELDGGAPTTLWIVAVTGDDTVYLSATLVAGGAVFAVTDRFGGMDPYEALAFNTGPGALSTRLWLAPGDTSLSSDPTVASSADGRLSVLVWEERASTAGKYLCYLIQRHGRTGVTSEGPFAVRVSGAFSEWAAMGGDPSVCVLTSGIFVAYQGNEGGIYLIRLARHPSATPYTAADRWAPVTPRDGNMNGLLGPGWLANVSGRTLSTGEERLAVVWENNGGDEFTENAAKHVSLEFVHYTPKPGVLVPFFSSGRRELTLGLIGEQFQLAAAVAVSHEWDPLGLTAEVMWMQMDGRSSASLMHATYLFDGDCVPA